MELAWRLLALLWLSTGGWIITVVAGIIAIPVGIVDVLMVLILGSGLSEGRVVGFVVDSLTWNAEQSAYILIGKGEFQAFPG